jgi:ADP-ribose pyrophosphatase
MQIANSSIRSEIPFDAPAREGRTHIISKAITYNMTSDPSLPEGWKIDSTKQVHSNNFIQVYEDVINIRGREKIYTRIKRKNYSTIVPFISKDQILVIKSYRHLVNSIQIEVPSGYIEDNEEPEEAAFRELREETGYRANELISVGAYTLDYTMFEQKGNLFVAYDLVNEGIQQLGTMELIEPAIMTVKEILKLLSEGKILNASSIVAFYWAINFHINRHNKDQLNRDGSII